MLLRFFRINDPYRLIGLLIIVILLGLPFFISPMGMMLSELKNSLLGEAMVEGKTMYVQVFDDTPLLAGKLMGLMSLIFGRSMLAGHIVALLIIFFQAGYFAILLINNKAYAETTYVPSLIFALLCFFSFDLLSFSPELLASTVLLFALNQLFHEIEFKIQNDVIILKLGVYLGLTTFLVFSYWVFLLLSIIILIGLTRAGFRKIALMIFGFLLPHALVITLYYYNGETGLLWKNYYISNMTLFGEMIVSTKGLFVLGAVPLTYFVFSIFMMNREARFTKYQSQLMQVMFLWLLFSLLQVMIARQVTPTSLITFIPPLAYFISHYLLLINRKWIAEMMLWLFIGGIMSMNLLTRAGRVESVVFKRMFPTPSTYANQIENQKVMLLGPGLEIYQRNELGGFFLNWKLSEPIFEDLDTYSNVEIVASCFQMDPPQVIIDKGDRMKQVMDRIPSLATQYKKEGIIYRKVNN